MADILYVEKDLNPGRAFKNIFKKIDEIIRRLNYNSNLIVYKSYVTSITQSGTSAPSPAILQNTLSGTPSWSRVGAGIYRLTLSGEFLDGKTYCQGMVSLGSPTTPAFVLFGVTGIEGYMYINRENDNSIRLTSVNASLVPTELNTLLGSGNIVLPEIRVYN